MEGFRQREQVAGIGLDAYLESLPSLYTVEGMPFEDEFHIFYFWVSKYHQARSVVDGVTLEALYRKNVIEGDMPINRFLQYCEQHDFPVPPQYQDGNDPTSFLNIDYINYRNKQAMFADRAYESFAAEHGIDTRPGSVMRFIDAEGNEYRVCTETALRGQILVD